MLCRATLKLERDPSSRITSSRIARCSSPGRRQPLATTATVASRTEATSGIGVRLGSSSISTAMLITIGLRRTVGRSSSRRSSTSRSLLAWSPRMESRGACSSSTSPSRSTACPSRSCTVSWPRRRASTVALWRWRNRSSRRLAPARVDPAGRSTSTVFCPPDSPGSRSMPALRPWVVSWTVWSCCSLSKSSRVTRNSRWSPACSLRSAKGGSRRASPRCSSSTSTSKRRCSRLLCRETPTNSELRGIVTSVQ